MMRNLVSLFGLDNFPFIVLLILGALAVTAGYYKKSIKCKFVSIFWTPNG